MKRRAKATHSPVGGRERRLKGSAPSRPASAAQGAADLPAFVERGIILKLVGADAALLKQHKGLLDGVMRTVRRWQREPYSERYLVSYYRKQLPVIEGRKGLEKALPLLWHELGTSRADLAPDRAAELERLDGLIKRALRRPFHGETLMLWWPGEERPLGPHLVHAQLIAVEILKVGQHLDRLNRQPLRQSFSDAERRLVALFLHRLFTKAREPARHKAAPARARIEKVLRRREDMSRAHLHFVTRDEIRRGRDEIPAVGRCLQCGTPLYPLRRGRKRKFCSRACRQRHYARGQRQARQPARRATGGR